MEFTREAKIVTIFEAVKANAKYLSGRFVDMDDLVQITMEKILKTKCLPQTPSEKWIFACTWNARNDVLRQIYRERNHREYFTFIDSIRLSYEEEDDSIVPSVVYEASDPYLVKAIETAISKLSKSHSDVFCLFAHGCSYTQISKLTASNVNTVRSRLFFAKASLRKTLAQYR